MTTHARTAVRDTPTPGPSGASASRPRPAPGSRRRAKPAGRRRRRTGWWNALAVLIALVWVFPIYWMLNSAFTPADQLQSNPPSLFPVSPVVSAFVGVLHSGAFWSSLVMSLEVTLLAVAVSMVAATLAAVTLSRFRFRGRKGVVVAVIVVQMIPVEALFISQYRMLDAMNLLNSVLGLSLLYVGTVLPFTVYMLKGFIDSVPVELEEAAMTDGCSRMGAFLRVTLPLLGPGLVSTGVFGFLVAWNEYALALVVLSSGSRVTLPIWLQSFSSNLHATDWNGVMAGSSLVAIPVIGLFLLVQNSMARGLAAGAVKG